MSFGKIRTQVTEKKDNPITFSDVQGIDEARDELGEIVDFLSDPDKFRDLGGEIPRGVLLMGDPGPEKLYWPKRSLAKPVSRSSASVAPILWKCLSVLVQVGFVIFSNRGKECALHHFHRRD